MVHFPEESGRLPPHCIAPVEDQRREAFPRTKAEYLHAEGGDLW
jgi:hypothetical protein